MKRYVHAASTATTGQRFSVELLSALTPMSAWTAWSEVWGAIGRSYARRFGHACQPPPEQDQWIREAARSDAGAREAARIVMRKSGGRCNPALVYAEIIRLRS